MKTVLIVLMLLALGACSGDDLPTCAEMGCRWAASGSPDHWSPCTSDVCWCNTGPPGHLSDEVSSCSRTPCAADGQCPDGLSPEFAQYTVPTGIAIMTRSVCYCMPTDGHHVVTVAE